ncbi:MAG: hypothetical protein WC809_16545 [Sinimarinibacterium sp.]|jgi:hypothetical protein
MRAVLAASLLAGLVAVVAYAHAESPSALPPGVAPSAWVQLGPTTGFVITNEGRSRQGTVSGYLMAQKNGAWLRLDVLNSPQIFDSH